ncbi:MAG TPA: haloacid dehalogenase-like hydrolase, partial [Pseudonocardiaceae bacterium]|nr:haloacid dehalogenase-like hydrolase [Pseudonocardiaceae bacterium]
MTDRQTATIRTLVLWDVDLTLVNMRRLGGAWYRRAVAEVTGRTLTEIPPFGGRTDRWITIELLSSVGLPASEDLIGRVQAAAANLAAEQRADIGELGFVLPGATESLRAVATLPDTAQSLVTGNQRPIAGYKVGAFGLDEYLDLDIGGYGELSEHRPALVADAITRASSKHGRRFERESVVVFGDTPHDVDAALASGARPVGVAS